jgi:hypothetical protein
LGAIGKIGKKDNFLEFTRRINRIGVAVGVKGEAISLGVTMTGNRTD